MKQLLIAILVLLVVFAAQAQDEEEAEAIGYLQLGSNFAVPDLPEWEHEVVGESALFTNAELNAEIYVSVYDTQDIDAAIRQALGVVYTNELGEPIYSSRIGRNDGTWEYRLFNIEDSSLTAYGMLKSGRVYVVLFMENSPDYSAYHLAIRSSIANPQGADLGTALSTASIAAIQAVVNPDFAEEANRISNPNADNLAWLLAEYTDEISTASYLNDSIIYVTLLQGDATLAPSLSNAFDTAFLGFVITPNNAEYLYLGLAFSAGIMLILLGSIWLRQQNLKKDLETIEQLAKE